MIKSAVHTFSASTSSEVNAKVSRSFFFEFISFGKSSINFWITLIKSRCPFYLCISIGKVLIIPNVIIVVSFYICRLLFRLFDLSSSWPLHPLLYLLIVKQAKQSVLSLVVRLLYLLFLLNRLYFFNFLLFILIFCIFLLILYRLRRILNSSIILRIHSL